MRFDLKICVGFAGALFASSAAFGTPLDELILAKYLEGQNFGAYQEGPVPIVFNDGDNTEVFVDDNGTPGDLTDDRTIIQGIVNFPTLGANIYSGSIYDATNGGVNTSFGTAPFRDISAVFQLQVVGETTDGNGKEWYVLGAVTGGLVDNIASGAVFALYEDDVASSASGASFATAAGTVTDGDLIATAGLSGGGNTFWLVSKNLAASGDDYLLSLNFIGDTSGLEPGDISITTNEFGTELFGRGNFTTSSLGEWYDFTSDGRFGVLYIPTPAAFGLGFLAFSLLGMARNRRRI